jgi:hypothetical protein
MFLDGLGRGVKHLLSTFFAINTLPIIGGDTMLREYYEDLFMAHKYSIKYLDLNQDMAKEASKNGLEPNTITKMNEYFKAHKMWVEKYNKLEKLNWYQKLFYKRES